MKHNTSFLKCFIEFTCTNLDGSQKEGVTFKFASEREGYPESGGVPSEKGGFQPWWKLWVNGVKKLNSI